MATRKRKTVTIGGKRIPITKDLFECQHKTCTGKCDACAFLKISILRREADGIPEPKA